MNEHDERPVVLVTGAAGNLGRLAVQSLHRDHTVVAVDRRPVRGLPKDVRHVQTDVRRRPIEDVFRTDRVQAILHLGLAHNPRGDDSHYRFNVVGTQRILDLAVKYQVGAVVVLSSANIYGPHPDNSHFLTEEAPLLAAEHHPEIRDLVAADRIVQSFFYRHPQLRTVLFRPVHIVGPRVRNAPSNYLRMPRPWMVTGFDPMIQLIHEEDVVRALVLAIDSDARGVFNLVGPGEAPLSRIFEVLGRSPRSLPSFLFQRVISQAWRYHISDFPAPELRHIQFNCVVDGRRAQEELAFTPSYSMEETIRSVDGFGY